MILRYTLRHDKMKRKYKVLLICFLLIIVNVSIGFGQKSSDKYKLKTIVIDPGHGGKDPGAVSKYGKESPLVLTISLKFGKLIKDNYPDMNVIYTRTDDSFVDLYKRAKIANDNNADFFICIHANSFKNGTPFGAETFVIGQEVTELNMHVVKKENSVILQEDNYLETYGGFDPNADETWIVLELFQSTHIDQSLKLAEYIQNEYKDDLKRFDRGVKQAPFLVLWKTKMPSILTEIGFISNDEEAKFLFSDEGQNQIAEGLFKAFKKYKTEYEKSIDQDFKEPDPIDNTTTNTINQANSGSNNEVTDNNNSIVFKVQIMSSPEKIKHDSKNFKGLNNVKEIKLNGVYKYTVGSETDYDKIIQIQSDTRKIFPDAFIIALKNNEKISLKQALKEIKK